MTTTTRVEDISPIERDEAMRLAEAENERCLDLLRSLDPADWTKPTDCALWDVRRLVAHVLGNAEAGASMRESVRQQVRTRRLARQERLPGIDAMTAAQVEARDHLSPEELVRRLAGAFPASVRARRRMPGLLRRVRIDPGIPGEAKWPLAFLMDTIFTRDVWMHRVDLSRAVERATVLTPGHDGRLVADVVTDWAGRHGQPFTLVLDGPAGGAFVRGAGGEEHRLDAVEFCRIVSGRSSGAGLLKTEVPF
jgi:uncharacterized protein (TIGR03083 family)